MNNIIESTTMCDCGHNFRTHKFINEDNGSPACPECGCDNFTPEALINAAVTQAVRTELESLREDHTLIPQQNMAFERQQDWSNGWSHSWQHQMNRIDHALAEYRTQEDRE